MEKGFDPMTVDDAVKAADLIIVTLPDEVQPEVYTKSIQPHLKAGKALGATHLVWMAFLVGLLTETRCWKERIFFALVFINFGLAFVMGFWSSASDVIVQKTRLFSAVLWGLSALVSFFLIFTNKHNSETPKASSTHV